MTGVTAVVGFLLFGLLVALGFVGGREVRRRV